MIRKMIRPLGLSKYLVRANRLKFSSTPTPNPDPNKNENKSQIKMNAEGQNKVQTQNKSKISKEQARLRVSRAELAKYARVELDYEKLNQPTQNMQTVANDLKEAGYKIKVHSQLGTRIQFHRQLQPQKKKPTPKPKNQKQTKSKEEEPKQQQEEQDQEQQKYIRYQWQVKIFTTANESFRNDKEQQMLWKLLHGNGQKKASYDLDMKNFKMSVNMVNIKPQHMNRMINNFAGKKKGAQDEDKEDIYEYDEDKFKEMTLYVRNQQMRSEGKWVKVEVMLQGFELIHLYKISVVKDLQSELKGKPTPRNQQQGVETRQLDPKLIEKIQDLLRYQALEPSILASMHEYSCFQEITHYRKWLEDIIDLTK